MIRHDCHRCRPIGMFDRYFRFLFLTTTIILGQLQNRHTPTPWNVCAAFSTRYSTLLVCILVIPPPLSPPPITLLATTTIKVFRFRTRNTPTPWNARMAYLIRSLLSHHSRASSGTDSAAAAVLIMRMSMSDYKLC